MRWRSILHPSVIYILIWLLVCFLINLKITNNLVDFSGQGAEIIYFNMISAVLILIFCRPLNRNRLKINLYDQIDPALKLANNLFKIWCFIFILDVLYSGGFPLMWLFNGDIKNYTYLGILSLKGLQHTLYFFFSIIYIVAYKYQKISKLKVLLIVLYPFLMLSRDLFLTLFLQAFCVLFFYKKIKKRQIFNLFLWVLLIAITFGIMGDIRTAAVNPFSSLINPDYKDTFDALPTGFTWLYVYTTANFNNILNTIGTFQESNSLGDIFYNLVPGALKDVFFNSRQQSALITNDNLNVASFYAGYVTAFGLYGAVLGGVFLQLVSYCFYSLSRNLNLGYVIAYSVMFSCICISIFFDAFLTVSTFAEISLSLYLAKKINQNFNNQVGKN